MMTVTRGLRARAAVLVELGPIIKQIDRLERKADKLRDRYEAITVEIICKRYNGCRRLRGHSGAHNT
jgi:hypothetical protein